MRRMILGLALLVVSVTAAFAQQATPTPAPDFLQITVAGTTCHLVIADQAAATPEATTDITASATAEATSEAISYPVIQLGDDCTPVIPQLYAPTNGTLWVALFVPGEFPWQQFQRVPGDPYPPKFDTRGRYVGCSIPDKGQQTCHLLWTYQSVTYEVNIPMQIGNYYVPGTKAPSAVPASAIPPTDTPAPTTDNSGVWGDCGSCTTCGGPVDHCVLAPDNSCVWDAARCENPKPKH